MNDDLKYIHDAELNRTELNNIEIYKVNISDLEVLQELSIKTFVDSFSKQNSKKNMNLYLANRFSCKKLKQEILNTCSEFYFAKLKNNIIGYIKVNFGNAQTEKCDSKSLEIERIYVLEDFQRKGVGQILYNKAVNIANDKKFSFIWLGVWEENHKAITFYQSIGFKSFDSHPFMLGDELQTDIMMKLSLN